MKLTSVFTIFIAILCLPIVTNAEESSSNLEILAERGKGVITQEDFTARVDRIPARARKEVLRDRNRVGDLLQALLIASQLATDAREAGFDKEKVVIDRMRLAADMELADAWLSHYVERKSTADYEALAYENYLLNQKSILTSARIDVSHILISTKERPEPEAKALAESIYLQLVDNPAAFDELVVEFSEDPSAASNQGKFHNVKKGDMVKPFEETAWALKPGSISEPVKTDYGYHIIRLDTYVEPKQLPFETVKARLIATEREKHNERVKNDYLGGLNSQETRMTEAQLKEMVRRQFGDDYVDPEVKRDDSE